MTTLVHVIGPRETGSKVNGVCGGTVDKDTDGVNVRGTTVVEDEWGRCHERILFEYTREDGIFKREARTYSVDAGGDTESANKWVIKFLLCLEYQRAKSCTALSLVGRGDSDGREKHRGQDGPAVMMRINVWRGNKGLSCFVFASKQQSIVEQASETGVLS